jgi:hypothetical protein
LQFADRGNASGPNFFAAVLRSSTFLGDQFVYDAIVKNELLVGKSRTVPAFSERGIQLYVDPSEIMVFPNSESKNRLLSLEQNS